jgi:hypothetical protein
MNARPTIEKRVWKTGMMVMILVCFCLPLLAQQKTATLFKVKDNRMTIVLSRDLSMNAVDSFIVKYKLKNIGLHILMKSGDADSLKSLGWQVLSDDNYYLVTKPLAGADLSVYPSGKVIFSPVPTSENWREVGGNRTTYGFNEFRNGRDFRREGDVTFFFLAGHANAKQVRLAGNFTNWQHSAFPMTKTDSGWIVKVHLQPGQWYYKFIINTNNWTTDPNNKLSENDGRGNENSVYFVPNRTFFLKGHKQAKKVFLTGTFNNWDDDDIPMNKTDSGWRVDMYIENGTYSYHYIVDGQQVDDEHSKWELTIGEPFEFKLKGFENAKQVLVAGNFNDWDASSFAMKRTNSGWEGSYVLGPGNYQYKFVVDGNWITDPDNPSFVIGPKGNKNSFMVIGANYTFELKGYDDAKNVFLAGDFNNWSKEGLRMQREGKLWTAKVYLAKGKHLYHFIVDGKVIRDPKNKAWEEEEWGGEQRSVIWMDPNEP